MSKFRFALNAAVVLSTSFANAEREASDQDKELRDAARIAGNRAELEVLRGAGRHDLVEPRKAKATAFGDDDRMIATVKLTAFHPPIESGQVLGRAEYVHSEPSYFVRYRGGDNRQVEAWIAESALMLDPRVAQANHGIETDGGAEQPRDNS